MAEVVVRVLETRLIEVHVPASVAAHFTDRELWEMVAFGNTPHRRDIQVISQLEPQDQPTVER
jgi:hypothetical protein